MHRRRRHGHDVNPGCDLDPRDSQPIHLGDDLEQLLLEYPHVIAWVAGPLAREQRRGAREPRRRRLLEHPGRGRGRLAAAEPPARVLRQQRRNALDLRHDRRPREPRDRPAPGPAAAFTPEELASVGRTIAYNDPQSGARACAPDPCGEGAAEDRNVELLVADPRRSGRRRRRRPGAARTRSSGSPKRDRLEGTAGGDRIRGRAGRRPAQRQGRRGLRAGRARRRPDQAAARTATQLKGGGGARPDQRPRRERDQVRCGAGTRPGQGRPQGQGRKAASCERVK